MKLDKRTAIPYGIALAFGLVTVGHVAHYAGAFEPPGWEWLGWPYAVAVDVAIVACAWLTTWATTRKVALAGYLLFIGASGALNVAHVAPWSQPASWAAWIYALFPTVAQAFMGILARNAIVLVQRSERSKGRAKEKPQPIADVAQGNGHKPLVCEFCDVPIPSGTRQGRSAHLRRCPVYLAQKKEGQRERV